METSLASKGKFCCKKKVRNSSGTACIRNASAVAKYKPGDRSKSSSYHLLRRFEGNIPAAILQALSEVKEFAVAIEVRKR